MARRVGGARNIKALLFSFSPALMRLVLRLPLPVRALFVYSANVVRWVDGDTVWLRVDLGFRFTAEMDFRLAGINTPERGKPGFLESVVRVNALAPVGQAVVIQSHKTDKYGRYLADMWTPSGLHINEALVVEGLAVPYMVNV